MKAIIQRVKFAKVIVNNEVYSEISKGLLIFVGITHYDEINDINFISNKICNLKVFEDEKGHLGKSLLEVNLDLLLVSNFTLYADTKKNRLSFLEAAKNDVARSIFTRLAKLIEQQINREIKVGDFGKYMNVQFDNDGPVTLYIES